MLNKNKLFEEETGFSLLENKIHKRRSNDISIVLPVSEYLIYVPTM